MGPRTAGGQHHGGKFDTAVFNLRGQLEPGAYITQGAQGVGAADRHQVRLLAAAAQAVGECIELVVDVVEVLYQFHFGIEQVQQQAVAVADVVRSSVPVGFPAGQRNPGRAWRPAQRLTHMFGLDGAAVTRVSRPGDSIGGQVPSLRACCRPWPAAWCRLA